MPYSKKMTFYLLHIFRPAIPAIKWFQAFSGNDISWLCFLPGNKTVIFACFERILILTGCLTRYNFADMAMHSIIDMNGSVQEGLIPFLIDMGRKVRLISPVPTNFPACEQRITTLLNYEQVVNDIKGAEVVYVLSIIPDESKMEEYEFTGALFNIMNACKEIRARLVYLDTAWVYTKNEVKCTPIHRGTFKAVSILQAEIAANKINATIARAGELYGPGYAMNKGGNEVLLNLVKNRNSTWYIDADLRHSFHFLPDVVRALYVLGTRPQAQGQLWNLPAVSPALTGRQFIEVVACLLKVSANIKVIPKWLLSLRALMDPAARELKYKYGFPVVVDSEKFEKEFDQYPTPYAEGIEATLGWLLNRL
jgi:nucleoside-diphosphate-sugar epimerase